MDLLPSTRNARTPDACGSRAAISLERAPCADLRGDRLAMIFQEPMTSLNPAFTIGDQIVEAHRARTGGIRAPRRARAPSSC